MVARSQAGEERLPRRGDLSCGCKAHGGLSGGKDAGRREISVEGNGGAQGHPGTERKHVPSSAPGEGPVHPEACRERRGEARRGQGCGFLDVRGGNPR